jgi:glycolate oxidase
MERARVFLGKRRGGRSGAGQAQHDAVRGLAELLGDAVITSPAGRMLYRGDGGVVGREPPAAVVLACDEAQLAEAVRYCHAHGLDMVPRGGATSLRGGAVGAADSVVIAMTRLNRIIEVDRRDRLVRAEAGAALTAIGRAARVAGLRLAASPDGRSPATLGGAIAKNIRGTFGPASGAIAGALEGLRLIAANGELIEIGAEAQVGGYDLAGLVAGSEGAFGIIFEATLRLMPAFPAGRVIVGRYGDERAALAAADKLLQCSLPVSALEVVGGRLWGGQSVGLGDWSAAGDESFVLVEVDGFEEEVALAAAEIAEVLSAGAPVAVEESADETVRRNVRARRACGAARLSRRGVAGVSDIVVPAGQVAAAAREMREIAGRRELSCISLMKPAEGCIQSIFLAADRDAASAARVEAAIAEAVTFAGEAGGLATGAFGAGALKVARAGYGGLDQATFGMQRLIKAVFDGTGRMNPGKVLVPVEDG